MLIDVRGGGELRVVEEAVDRFQNHRVGVEEDDALVGELPEAKLGEIVERGVEGGLFALGEGGAGVLLAAGVGGVEGGGGGQELAGGEAGAARGSGARAAGATLVARTTRSAVVRYGGAS